MSNKLKQIVNTVPADALAPDGARASAGTVLTMKPGIIFYGD